MHHHATGCCDWLISEHQSADPSGEVISMLSEKYKRFTFVHPVAVGATYQRILSFVLLRDLSFSLSFRLWLGQDLKCTGYLIFELEPNWD